MSPVRPIATVPQKVMRITARSIEEPPAFAAMAPSNPKNAIAKTYCSDT